MHQGTDTNFGYTISITWNCCFAECPLGGTALAVLILINYSSLKKSKE